MAAVAFSRPKTNFTFWSVVTEMLVSNVFEGVIWANDAVPATSPSIRRSVFFMAYFVSDPFEQNKGAARLSLPKLNLAE